MVPFASIALRFVEVVKTKESLSAAHFVPGKKAENCRAQEQAKYHKKALVLADAYVQSAEKPESSPVFQMDSKRVQKIERNRSILKCGKFGSVPW